MDIESEFQDPLMRARASLRKLRPLVVLSGAGISTEYGLPTFRGDNQLWRGRRIEEVLTPESYRADRRFVWDWHLEMREKSALIVDVPIHRQLAEWSRLDGDVHVITQNIDGLHERAGQERLVCLHGSLWRNRCGACQRTRPDTSLRYDVLPRCPHCRDGRERPDVIWYGESLDRRLYRRAESLVSSARLLLQRLALPRLPSTTSASVLSSEPRMRAPFEWCDATNSVVSLLWQRAQSFGVTSVETVKP